MKIKKLEWKDWDDLWTADISILTLVISKKRRGFFVKSPVFSITHCFDTLQEAKDAAQAALEEYVRGFCTPDALDSQIEALIRENLELKGLLENASAQNLNLKEKLGVYFRAEMKARKDDK